MNRTSFLKRIAATVALFPFARPAFGKQEERHPKPGWIYGRSLPVGFVDPNAEGAEQVKQLLAELEVSLGVIEKEMSLFEYKHCLELQFQDPESGKIVPGIGSDKVEVRILHMYERK